MTDEQINIAIAEACGWTDFSSAGHAGSIQYGRKPGSSLASWELPRYVNDLNAMREAEMTLSLGRDRKQWDISRAEFRSYLRLISGHFGSIHATARQRAEAFLRTLGKWEESE
jgi:hypothetical protein